jgi:hypothetical protein
MKDGSVFSEFPPKAVGFVYIITRKSDGKFYIGKKKANFKRTKQIKGKKKKYEVESDWRTYFGSNTELQNDVLTLGADQFERKILHVCFSLSECSYRETEEIFKHECLLREDCYNSWVSSRITKKHVQGKLQRLSVEHVI